MCLKNKTSGYSCELISFVKGLDVPRNGRIQGYPKRLSPARFVEYIDDILLELKPPSERFLGANNLFTGLVEEKAFVHSIESTGRRGKLSYTVLCGKTGTAQWGPPNKEQRLAWFAGFFPFLVALCAQLIHYIFLFQLPFGLEFFDRSGLLRKDRMA